MSAGITAGARGAAAGLGQASAGNARTLPRPRKPGLKSKSRGLETSVRTAAERREASAPEADDSDRPWRAPRPWRGQVATSVRVVRPISFAPSGAPPPFICLEAKQQWLSFLPQNSGARRAARTGSLVPSATAIARQDDWICVRLRNSPRHRRCTLHANDNLTTERPTFVTHLECSMTGEHYAADEIHNLSRAGKPLLVRYDLDGVKQALSKDALASRPPDLWRYRELLPVRRTENIVSLGETMTPLLPLPAMAKKLRGGEILVKDEGRLPTGSFKARGLVMAVSMAKAFGIKHMAIPTNGNAGAALAAYASHAGIKTTIFCPEDTPEINLSEIGIQGAAVYRVNGLIDDCGKIVGEGKQKVGWFDVSTLKEPYRIEGKKTMGLELAEQLGWSVPDVIFYPTGGGTGLIGMWKAFAELEAIGFIGTKRPRMVAVQAEGCAPMVRAYEEGVEHARRWEDAHTIAAGIRVPQAVGDFLIMRAVRESNGFAIAVSDEAISQGLEELAREEGFLMCPEGAATYAAYKKNLADGRVKKSDQVILFNCATGLKYPLPPIKKTLDRHKPIDFAAL